MGAATVSLTPAPRYQPNAPQSPQAAVLCQPLACRLVWELASVSLNTGFRTGRHVRLLAGFLASASIANAVRIAPFSAQRGRRLFMLSTTLHLSDGISPCSSMLVHAICSLLPRGKKLSCSAAGPCIPNPCTAPPNTDCYPATPGSCSFSLNSKDCTYTPLPAGTPCSSGVCDGAGACVPDVTTAPPIGEKRRRGYSSPLLFSGLAISARLYTYTACCLRP